MIHKFRWFDELTSLIITKWLTAPISSKYDSYLRMRSAASQCWAQLISCWENQDMVRRESSSSWSWVSGGAGSSSRIIIISQLTCEIPYFNVLRDQLRSTVVLMLFSVSWLSLLCCDVTCLKRDSPSVSSDNKDDRNRHVRERSLPDDQIWSWWTVRKDHRLGTWVQCEISSFWERKFLS